MFLLEELVWKVRKLTASDWFISQRVVSQEHWRLTENKLEGTTVQDCALQIKNKNLSVQKYKLGRGQARITNLTEPETQRAPAG